MVSFRFVAAILLHHLAAAQLVIQNDGSSNLNINYDDESRDYFAVELETGFQADNFSFVFDSVVQNLGLDTTPDDLRLEGSLPSLSQHYIFSLSKYDQSDSSLLENWSSHLKRRSIVDTSGLKFVEKVNPRKKLHKRYPVPSYTPNFGKPKPEPDPLALKYQQTIQQQMSISDPEFPEQWHLLNVLQPNKDVNVTQLWLEGVTGEGVVVAIVDDGLEHENPDIKVNYCAEGSYDYNDPGPDPNPKLADDKHGTRCAGEIAAVRNDKCGVGVAFNARVAGIRILSKEISEVDEAQSLNYRMDVNDIYSCSWGPSDNGATLEGPSVLIKRAFVNGVTNGRKGRGSIFVFASGNGGMQGDNCNFDGYTNSIFSITIGAVDRVGLHPPYSEDCSALLAVTYSSGSGDYIHTTDVGPEGCTSAHSGTSAAAPLAAGILSLVLQVRPDLTWRDMQYLVLDTSIPSTNPDADIQITPMGKSFSHRYGYGIIDSYELVQAAKTWELVDPQAWYESPVNNVGKTFTPEESAQAVITITEEDLKNANVKALEHVNVVFSGFYLERGSMSIELTSPSGIVSQLATYRRNDRSREAIVDWTFMTVAHWGESGIGDWTLSVKANKRLQISGRFDNWQLKLWGVAIDASKAVKLPLPGGGEKTMPDMGQPETTTNTLDSVPTSTVKIIDPITTSSSYDDVVPTTDVTENPLPTWSDPDDENNEDQDHSEDDEDYGDDDNNNPEDNIVKGGWLPTFGYSRHTAVWIYGAIGLITAFIIGLSIYICVKRRKGKKNWSDPRGGGGGGQSYEFEMLPTDADFELSDGQDEDESDDSEDDHDENSRLR